MALIKAKCTECGAPLQVNDGSKKAKCPHCGNVFIVEDAVNNYNYTYNTTNNINTDVVNIINQKEDFVIESGVLTKYQGKSDVVVIPDGVKKIDDEVFEKSGIRKITLPDSLKYIGNFAFESCEFLEEIDFNCVEKIGNCAFRESGLTKIYLPKSVQKVGVQAFANCENLKDIQSDSDIVELDAEVFYGYKEETLSLTIGSCINSTFQGTKVKDLTVYGGSFSYNPTIDGDEIEKLTIRTKEIGELDANTVKEMILGKEVDKIESIETYYTNIEVEDFDKLIHIINTSEARLGSLMNVYHNGQPIKTIKFTEKSKGILNHYHSTFPDKGLKKLKVYSSAKQKCCPVCGYYYGGIMGKLAHKCGHCGVKLRKLK